MLSTGPCRPALLLGLLLAASLSSRPAPGSAVVAAAVAMPPARRRRLAGASSSWEDEEEGSQRLSPDGPEPTPIEVLLRNRREAERRERQHMSKVRTQSHASPFTPPRPFGHDCTSCAVILLL